MRTSRISQDTTKLFNAIVSSSPRPASTNTRATRRAVRAFTRGNPSESNEHNPRLDQQDPEDRADRDDISLATPISTDIEDALSTRASSRSSRKRKRGTVSPAATVATAVTRSDTVGAPRRSQRPRGQSHIKDEDEGEHIKQEDWEGEEQASAEDAKVRAKAKPKIPARKTTAEDGTVTIHPPSNWEEIYHIITDMRARNPTAPVDTMGCEELYWRASPPKEQRYHTLTSLMLSSQTKDTVTAVAMQRLHTELAPLPPTQVDSKSSPPSCLTVENVLACDPKHLDNLIGKVGFHNNKTRYIKQTAEILASKYASDIPSTIKELVSLPGVGPKMAYLCLSAAWGITEGIGVDVHVHRITNMWGWHTTKTPEETRAWLEGWLPKEKWHHINKMLVGLGQTVCLPVGRKCWECDLAGTGLCKGEIRSHKIKEEKRRAVKVQKKEEGDDVIGEETKIEIKEELAGD